MPKLREIDFEHGADPGDLTEGEPPLARLVLADKGLRQAQPLGEIGLPQAGSDSRGAQKIAQPSGVFGGCGTTSQAKAD